MKIKCPHCGANNQDVTEKDPCWQCSAVLGAAPTPVVASAGSPPAADSGPVQQVVRPKETPVSAPTKIPTDVPRGLPIIPIAVVIVIVVIVCAVYLMMRK